MHPASNAESPSQRRVSEMTALRAHRRGGPEQLRVEDAPLPQLQDGEVLVQVHAAAVTFNELLWDETWTRHGTDRTPIIPSHEWSGIIRRVGPTSALKVGDPVFGMVPFDRDGAAAEYLAAGAEFVAPKPTGISHVEAAALPLAGLTACQALVDHAAVRSGDRVLVLGAAGGVGAFVVQLALRLGAHVTTTAMPRDTGYVQSLGADEVYPVLDRRSHSDQLRQQSFDVVVDTVGGALLEPSMQLTRRGGVFITLQQPPPTRLAEELGIRAVFFVVSCTRAGLDLLRDLVQDGQLGVEVAATYPLSKGREAFQSGSLPGRLPGKTVLVVSAEDQPPTSVQRPAEDQDE